jgi:VWFA-related protein
LWGWALGCTSCFAVVALAQDSPASRFVEAVEIQLVSVEVWVTDEAGQPVSGLGADDFVLLHDGEPVPVEYFSEVGGARAGVVSDTDGVGMAPTVDSRAASADARPPGYLIVYFDDLNLHPGNRKILADELESFLREEGSEAETVLILRQDSRLFVEAPFGSTGAQLREALTRIRESGSIGASLATDVDQAIQEIQAIWTSSKETAGSAGTGLAGVPQGAAIATIPGSSGDGSPAGVVGGAGGGRGGLAPSSCEVFVRRVEPLLDNHYRQRAAQLRTTLERLSEAVTFLAGLEGPKTLLYLGDRMETAPAAGLASYAAGYCPTEQRSLLMNSQREDLSQLMTEIARHASANRVTIYGVQGGGLRSGRAGSAAEAGQEFRGAGRGPGTARVNQQGGFLVLSEQTGGRAVVNTNNFGDAFRQIRHETSHYYSIAYRPPVASAERFHTIEVKVPGKDLSVRHRPGYRHKSADDLLAERVLGALNLGVTDNPLSIRLAAGRIEPSGEGRFTLPLRVLVPVQSVTFVGADQGSEGELRFKVNAHDTERGELINVDRLFRLTLPPGQADESVTVGVDLDLEAGVYVIAVGLRDANSGAMSFVSTTLEIGDDAE